MLSEIRGKIVNLKNNTEELKENPHFPVAVFFLNSSVLFLVGKVDWTATLPDNEMIEGDEVDEVNEDNESGGTKEDLEYMAVSIGVAAWKGLALRDLNNWRNSRDSAPLGVVWLDVSG